MTAHRTGGSEEGSSMADEFDVIVIGGGTAGLTSALAARHEGASVALVEREAWIGGDCTFNGCVPSAAGIEIIYGDASFGGPDELAVGRRCTADALGHEHVAVTVEDGYVPVDSRCRTNAGHIYALQSAFARGQQFDVVRQPRDARTHDPAGHVSRREPRSSPPRSASGAGGSWRAAERACRRARSSRPSRPARGRRRAGRGCGRRGSRR